MASCRALVAALHVVVVSSHLHVEAHDESSEIGTLLDDMMAAAKPPRSTGTHANVNEATPAACISVDGVVCAEQPSAPQVTPTDDHTGDAHAPELEVCDDLLLECMANDAAVLACMDAGNGDCTCIGTSADMAGCVGMVCWGVVHAAVCGDVTPGGDDAAGGDGTATAAAASASVGCARGVGMGSTVLQSLVARMDADVDVGSLYHALNGAAAPRDTDGLLAALLNLPRASTEDSKPAQEASGHADAGASVAQWWATVFRKTWWHHRAPATTSTLLTDGIVQGGFLTPQSVQFGALAELAGVAATEDDLACMCRVLTGGELLKQSSTDVIALMAHRASAGHGTKMDDTVQARAHDLQQWMKRTRATLIYSLEAVPDCVWERQPRPHAHPWLTVMEGIASAVGVCMHACAARWLDAPHYHATITTCHAIARLICDCGCRRRVCANLTDSHVP